MKNRKKYHELIIKAARYSNHVQKKRNLIGNEIYFYDSLDWDCVNNEATWTDVYFKIDDKKSSYAFTMISQLAIDVGEMDIGCIPESFIDKNGCWSFFVHKDFFTQDDVGNMCRKWISMLAPIEKFCLGVNVHFNDKPYGHISTYFSYPHERMSPSELKNFGYHIQPVKMNECPTK